MFGRKKKSSKRTVKLVSKANFMKLTAGEKRIVSKAAKRLAKKKRRY